MNKTEFSARIRQEVLAQHYRDKGELLIPVTVSNRHVHLDEAASEALFGPGYRFTPKKDLVQLGQFACEETITIRGPKRAIEKVRVLGPLRPFTQAELSVTDCRMLGIAPTLRLSGDIDGSPELTLTGPRGSYVIRQGAIVAARHLHVPLSLADVFGLQNGQLVTLSTEGERPADLRGIIVRVSEGALLEAHVDTDEANATGIRDDMLLKLTK